MTGVVMSGRTMRSGSVGKSRGRAMFWRMRRELELIRAALATASAERDAYLQQRDVAIGERNEILRQRDVAIGECKELQRQRDIAVFKSNEFLRQRDIALGERDALAAQLRATTD
jgi:hypothetical protein